MTTNAEQAVTDLTRRIALAANSEVGGLAQELREALTALETERTKPKSRTFLVHYSFQSYAGNGVGNTFVTDTEGRPVTQSAIESWQEILGTKNKASILVLGFTELEGR